MEFPTISNFFFLVDPERRKILNDNNTYSVTKNAEFIFTVISDTA
jgi:hypothetical protein